MPQLPDGASTVLTIMGVGIPPYSSRGIRQTLTPISAAANLRRTINGELIDLSPVQFKKYKSSLSCNDFQPPALDGIWPGLQITVGCIKELGFLTAGNSPAKTVVEGSLRTDGIFSFYRPVLIGRITSFSDNFAEWEAGDEWQLEFEEI